MASTLAYGTKSVPLAFIIQNGKEPNPATVRTWEERAIQRAPLEGLEYKADCLTVHLFILDNLGEDSDAYTYIEPLLARQDERRDVIALRGRFENEVKVQTCVNQANKIWESLIYKNKHAMTFEAFCSRFQKALQHYERAGWTKHQGDVINWIWGHIQNSELGQTLAALKASQTMAGCSPTKILQEIAKDIPNLHGGSNFQLRVSAMGTGGTLDYTFEGWQTFLRNL